MAQVIERFPGSFVTPVASNGTDTDRPEVCPTCGHAISFADAATRVTDGVTVHLADCRKWDW